MVDGSGNVRITDFGLATIARDPTSLVSSSENQGHTLRWTAPEVLGSSQGVTKQSDVFSFGMVMIEVGSNRSITPLTANSPTNEGFYRRSSLSTGDGIGGRDAHPRWRSTRATHSSQIHGSSMGTNQEVLEASGGRPPEDGGRTGGIVSFWYCVSTMKFTHMNPRSNTIQGIGTSKKPSRELPGITGFEPAAGDLIEIGPEGGNGQDSGKLNAGRETTSGVSPSVLPVSSSLHGQKKTHGLWCRIRTRVFPRVPMSV